ncbi:MAG: YwiC-like family protein [Verrucomicrobia bacterium]|nr:YwiC-like family protein [Verrucomicrobiota bacterium]
MPPLSWRELVLPKEHGSWAFAFEPIALGLLIAPSAAGGWLAPALASAFFARRPLRTALGDARPAYRAAARRALLAAAWPR